MRDLWVTFPQKINFRRINNNYNFRMFCLFHFWKLQRYHNRTNRDSLTDDLHSCRKTER